MTVDIAARAKLGVEQVKELFNASVLLFPEIYIPVLVIVFFCLFYVWRSRRKAGLSETHWTLRLFSGFIWLGLSMLLLSIALDGKVDTSVRWIHIAVNLLESVGIAIFIASIFSFVVGTSEFISQIQKLLRDIILQRTFLTSLGLKDKRRALLTILSSKGSEDERVYSNIDRYHQRLVDNAIDTSKGCIRGSFHIDATASYDSTCNLVVTKIKYSYKLYPGIDGYPPVPMGFDEDDTLSTCESMYAYREDKDRLKWENVPPGEIRIGNNKWRFSQFEVNNYGEGADYLRIEINTLEYGGDHWQLLYFLASQPTDGFTVSLKCNDGLKIKKNYVFIVGNSYYTDKEPDNSEMRIVCNQWVNAGLGLSVVIARPCEPSSCPACIGQGGD